MLSFSVTASAADNSTPSQSGAPEADDENGPKPLTKEERERVGWLKHLKISGFVQPQLVMQHFNDEASPNGFPAPAGVGANQVIVNPKAADGTTTNAHFFTMRRARLKTEFWAEDWAKFVFEIDPFLGGGTTKETGTIARNVEAVGIVRWSEDALTEFGAGIFKVPFGAEILQSDADRPFIERSWQERNLFPAEFEYGARAYTSLLQKKLVIQLAYTNGQMLGEKTFVLQPDTNNAKDMIGRVNYDFGPVDVGVSGILGRGEIVELATAPATGGRTKSYGRSGVDLEAAFHHTFLRDLGKTKLMGELIFAKNLDRGTNYSFAKPVIPTVITDDVSGFSERGFFVRLEQDLGKYVLVAVRYDQYTPDTSLDSNARKQIGGVFMIRVGKGLELRSEYAYIMDDVHKAPAAGKPDPGPANKKIHFMSYVLQTRF
ncbi:MAG: porin [Polyangiales bacterium]